jgi:hypothetical protein
LQNFSDFQYALNFPLIHRFERETLAKNNFLGLGVTDRTNPEIFSGEDLWGYERFLG